MIYAKNGEIIDTNNQKIFTKTIHMWNNIVIDMLEKNIINNDKIWYNEYLYIKNYLMITNS